MDEGASPQKGVSGPWMRGRLPRVARCAMRDRVGRSSYLPGKTMSEKRVVVRLKICTLERVGRGGPHERIAEEREKDTEKERAETTSSSTRMSRSKSTNTGRDRMHGRGARHDYDRSLVAFRYGPCDFCGTQNCHIHAGICSSATYHQKETVFACTQCRCSWYNTGGMYTAELDDMIVPFVRV